MHNNLLQPNLSQIWCLPLAELSRF